MIDMASTVREQIYGAIRAFTCASVDEAEAATKAIVRLVGNALPYDGARPMTGFISALTPEQQKKAREYDGPENIGP